jgi:hypothetical protein
MLKALKWTMIIYAIIGILFGLAMIIIPDQLRDWFNMEQGPDITYWFITLLATTWIVVGVFFIMAARDVIKNILWVKFAIAHAIIDAVATLYVILRDYADFSQVGIGLIIHVVFAILLLIFYPWKAGQSS